MTHVGLGVGSGEQKCQALGRGHQGTGQTSALAGALSQISSPLAGRCLIRGGSRRIGSQFIIVLDWRFKEPAHG